MLHLMPRHRIGRASWVPHLTPSRGLRAPMLFGKEGLLDPLHSCFVPTGIVAQMDSKPRAPIARILEHADLRLPVDPFRPRNQVCLQEMVGKGWREENDRESVLQREQEPGPHPSPLGEGPVPPSYCSCDPERII